jgi:RNA polymerase sigma-70 factor (ECF subfamily)
MAHETTMSATGTEDAQALDAALVHAAQTDPTAFAPLYQRYRDRIYRDRIYRYLRTRTSSDEDAVDLTQQVFLQASRIRPHMRQHLCALLRAVYAQGSRSHTTTVRHDPVLHRLHPCASTHRRRRALIGLGAQLNAQSQLATGWA